MMITGPFAEALERDRDRFNAKFIAARHANPKLAADVFLEHLASNIDPAVRAVAGVFEEKVDVVTAALYDLSLELFRLGLLSREVRQPALIDAWRRLLPAAPRLLAREPARLAGSICNALHNLAATPGARADEWVESMIGLAPNCLDVATFLDCGKLLAWRCGLPQFRSGALATGKSLDPTLAARALGTPEDTAPAKLHAAIDRIANDPWLNIEAAFAPSSAKREVAIVSQAGAFRGFGGLFSKPPTVSYRSGDFVVTDGQGAWVLRADAFGSALFRIDAAEKVAAAPPPLGLRVGTEGNIQWESHAGSFPELADPSSFACDGTTLAITLPTSHHVFLLART